MAWKWKEWWEFSLLIPPIEFIKWRGFYFVIHIANWNLFRMHFLPNSSRIIRLPAITFNRQKRKKSCSLLKWKIIFQVIYLIEQWNSINQKDIVAYVLSLRMHLIAWMHWNIQIYTDLISVKALRANSEINRRIERESKRKRENKKIRPDMSSWMLPLYLYE